MDRADRLLILLWLILAASLLASWLTSDPTSRRLAAAVGLWWLRGFIS